MTKTLHVDLTDGFDDDRVEVSVNGEVQFDKSATTRTQIGRAASFEVDVDQEAVQVVVRVPDRGLTATRDIQLDDDHWLGVGVDSGGSIEIVDQPTPFGFA